MRGIGIMLVAAVTLFASPAVGQAQPGSMAPGSMAPKASCKVSKALPSIRWDSGTSEGMRIYFGWSLKNCRGIVSKVKQTLYAVKSNGTVSDTVSFTYTFQRDQANERVRVSRYWYLDAFSSLGQTAVEFFYPSDMRALVNCTQDRRGERWDLSGIQFYMTVTLYNVNGGEIGRGVVTDRVTCGENLPPR